jgi:nitric oxide reductase NorQ protein
MLLVVCLFTLGGYLMSRSKSSSTVFIEKVLIDNPNIRYNDVVGMEEYVKGGHSFDNAYFNAIKCRIKKVQSYVSTGSVSAPSHVISSAPVDGNDSEYKYDSDTQDLIPAVDPHYVINEDAATFFELVKNMSNNKNVNVRLVGPAGCGKTSLAMQYAARHGLPCFVQNCANVREPRDWFGYRKLDENKNLAWHESLFVKMIETPNAVIVLDETNRCPMHTLNTLYPLLDHRRNTWLEEAGRTLQVAEGVTFWAAMNEGNQFTGTTQLDEAFSDRTGLVMECKFLSSDDEAKVLHNRTGLTKDSSLRLVEIAEQVRKKAQLDTGDSFSKVISTRMLEEAASAFVVGGPKTMHYTLLNHFSAAGGASSERQNLLKLLVGKFGTL